MRNVFSYFIARTGYIQGDNDVHYAIDQHA